LYADGTLSVHTGHWEVPEGRGVSPQQTESARAEKGAWTTTYPTGEKIMYKGSGEMEELKAVMISVASDPETNQVSRGFRPRDKSGDVSWSNLPTVETISRLRFSLQKGSLTYLELKYMYDYRELYLKLFLRNIFMRILQPVR
jgi:hypothetical protein